MKTMEIAKKMVELNRQGRGHDILALYSQDAVSVEAGAPPGTERESKGLDAIRKKGEWWFANHEVHSFAVTGPWPHDDRFIVGYQIDVTHKPSGRRIKMEEAALYTVRDCKIVREEFFYVKDG